MEILEGTQKFRILTRKRDIFKKANCQLFKKCYFWGEWCQKLSLSKIGVMDMSYIMDSVQNGFFITIRNFVSLISADPADLSNIKK
eukprot:UN20837